ncbi:MAG: Fic family protein [Alphaproteobacteria bacterium]|nr:MAG: Fic family protein [Alphaproteobacteria bacterium]
MTYIHERKDWPEFRWDEPLIGGLLANLRHRQGRLLGRMEAMGFSLREEAVLRTLTSDVIKTSEIEGETLDHDQVRSSLARRLGIEIGALTPAERNVEGIVEVMLDATQKFREPLTEDRLFGWHAALFPTGRSGMSKIIVGNWRDDSDGPMQVISGPFGRERVHFEAPEAKRLKREMRAFLKWYNDGPAMDAVLKAAHAHLWFVTIHPFADGNGRIARAIADMSLARSEDTAQRFYSMSTQIRTERSMYYKQLEQTQKGDLDITDWLNWFLGCLERAFLGAEEILSVVLHKAEFWNTHKDANLNERQKLMLNKLLDGFDGKLTSSKWAKIAHCSQDTASRDIDALIKLRILQKDEGGGRSTSYSLKDRQGGREHLPPSGSAFKEIALLGEQFIDPEQMTEFVVKMRKL